MKKPNDKLFINKYAPKTMSELILPERFRIRFKNGFSSLSRILLHSSSPGTGKSSLAKILVNEFKHPNLLINASKEGSIELLRDEVPNFCLGHNIQSIKSNEFKVIIFDEIDGASKAFFDGLRSLMEDPQYDHIGFIATCNNFHKIPKAVKSRFDQIDFTFTDEDKKVLKFEYAKRILSICKRESISISKEALESLIIKFFPDLRSTIMLIQNIFELGVKNIELENIKKSYSVNIDLFNLVFDGSEEDIYKLIMDKYSNQASDILSSFFIDFFHYIIDEKPDYKQYIPKILIKVAEYQNKYNSIIDPILAPIAMIYELQLIIKND